MASVTGRRRDPSGLAAALGTPIGGGVQKPTRFEGGATHVLEAKMGEAGTFEQTGLTLSTSQISKLKVEVNSVV